MGVTLAILSVLGHLKTTTALLALAQFVSFARLAVGNASRASPTNQDTPLLVPLRMSGKKIFEENKAGLISCICRPGGVCFCL